MSEEKRRLGRREGERKGLEEERGEREEEWKSIVYV